jgi:hypothetical protein
MLTQDDERKIGEIVATEILKSQPQNCACGPDATRRIGHFLGMMRDLGERGDADNGIERLRDTIRLSSRIQRISTKIGYLVLTFFVMAILGLAWAIGKFGIMAWLGRG